MILQPSKSCRNNEIEVIGILQQNCQVIYGLNPVNLNKNLWLASFDAICERFKDITIQDIQNSYRYAEIEKKAYTTLTRDELIQPIFEYWTKRNILIAEIKKLENAKIEELQAIEASREFIRQSKQKYLDSLIQGVWLGDEFEADAIARNFKDVLKQEEKNEIMNLAKYEELERLEKQKNDKANQMLSTLNQSIVPSWRKIFSRIYIERMIEKQIKFIQD